MSEQSGTDYIFERSVMAGINVRNRIFRSATDEGMADDEGYPTEGFYRLYERLADNEVGCIFTTYMAVRKDATPMKNMIHIDSDDRIPHLERLTELVHSKGCPIVCQIAHAGTKSIGDKIDINRMSEDAIDKTVAEFVDAGERAFKAGFDGVQLHCAHGYFLSECLSPHTNRRKDIYGNDPEGRFRIVKRIIEGIRIRCPNFPILVKMNGFERAGDGIKPDSAADIAVLMESSGIDAIEVSCSLDEGLGPMHGDVPIEKMFEDLPEVMNTPRILRPAMRALIKRKVTVDGPRRMYNIPAALAIKERVRIPVIAVGGIHDMDEIEKVLIDDGIDYVSMCRPLIIEPNLIRRYKEGTVRHSECTECNRCIIAVHQHPLRCYRER